MVCDSKTLRFISLIMMESIPDLREDHIRFLEGPYGARRRGAIIKYLDRAEEEFRGYGLQDVRKAFAESQSPHPFLLNGWGLQRR